MSNQAQAHVADERAAFEESPDIRSMDLSRGFKNGYADHDTRAAWRGWQAARAAIPAGADVAVAIQMPNTEQVRDLMRKAKIPESQCWIADVLKVEEVIRSVIAAGAPAETPKPELRARCQVVGCDGNGNLYNSRGYHYGKCSCAAQPAPAPATMADCPECEGTGRVSSVALCQSCNESGIVPAPATDAAPAVEIAGRIFGFKHWKQDEEQKARWEQFAAEIRAAMLSANSPREAG